MIHNLKNVPQVTDEGNSTPYIIWIPNPALSDGRTEPINLKMWRFDSYTLAGNLG